MNTQAKFKFLILIVAILAMLGMFDAGYLTYEKLSGGVVACGRGFDCQAVLQSQWATVGPIPLSVFGLIYYTFIYGLAVLTLLKVQIPFPTLIAKLLLKISALKNSPNQLHINLAIIKLLSLTGVMFSLFLVFLMAVIIKAWCLYCIASASISLTIFIIVWSFKSEPVHEI